MKQSQISISAAILAGGKSLRFGSDKALAEINGKPLIQRVIEGIPVGIADIFIIGNENRRPFDGFPVYNDLITSCGPLAGIYTGLQKSKHASCLILACDMPFVSKRLLERLLKEHLSNDGIATVYESSGGLEPLFAIYPKSATAVIAAQITKRDFKALNLLQNLELNIVKGEGEDDDRSICNINTIDELKKAKRLF